VATERVSSFRADGIDLSVRQGRPPFGASLHADLLFRHEVVAVCSPSLIAEQQLPLDASALARLTLLHDTHDLWPAFLKQIAGAGDLEARGLRFNQTTLSLDAALSGQGIALASRFLVRRDLEGKRLVQPLEAALAGDQDFYLLAPRNGASTSASVTRRWLLSIATAENTQASCS